MRSVNSSRTMFANAFGAFVLLMLCSIAAPAQSTTSRSVAGTPEQRAARYFESTRKSPLKMLAFLSKMPKGADLHNHLSGSIYAESYVQWAAEKGLCVNQRTMTVTQPPCVEASGQVPVNTALSNSVLYRQLIDAWSMRNWQYSGQNGHDQFFDAFAKFSVATYGQTGQMLAEVSSRAARSRLTYLELMLTPDGGMASAIGQTVGWDGDFEGTLNKLKSNGIDKAVAEGIKALKDAEAEKDKLLKCGTAQADPGCSVTIRYISQVSRGGQLGPVFAQMVTGFTLANDPSSKVVGLNLVQPEDWLSSMQNFSTQMEMLNFLQPRYPQAHVTLHAGELTPGMVPPEGLTFHVRDSVMKGHAQRIGHGVSIMLEEDPYSLLKELVRRNVMIEICLTSNDTILGVRKEQHPLSIYLEYGVPMALATDDAGIARSEISREYLKAAEDHGLGYVQLKTMARASLQYAFLPGGGLWSDAKKLIPVSQCAPPSETSNACKQYLAANEKARLQWKLEEDFKSFERDY